MKKCRYCSEDIQNDAIKCKHCGEMQGISDASDSARAVTKGLKKKEIDDLNYNVGIFFSILFGVIVGSIFKSFILGTIIFFAFGFVVFEKWRKE